MIKTAKLTLENGKTLEIEAVNQSSENIHVTKVTVNGINIRRNYLTHKELMDGGKIIFVMGK
jgi:putative alpha-1,2-mannosidase